jgi:hypothetical protein
MSKTKTLVLSCKGEIKIIPSRKSVTVHIEEPDVEDALTSFYSDDIIEFVAKQYGADEVYDEKQLAKWAEENGYIKE